jgi:hypothetical protein
VAEPIIEQWVVALIAQLNTITVGGGYFHTVKLVGREYKEVTGLRKGEIPAVQLGLLSLIQDQETWPLITVLMSQEIIMSVANTQDAPTQLQRLKSDVEKCIRVESTLGGLCLNMHVVTGDLNTKTDIGGTLEGRVIIESTTWHRQDDPTRGRS